MTITVFDLETTGVDKNKDQIIQFAGLKIDSETHKIVDELNLYIQPFGDYSISIGAYFKHQITPEFLKDKPYLSEVAPQIHEFMNSSEAILTYNGNSFDIPFLKIELNRYGYDIDFTKIPCYDAFMEERKRNGMTLEDVYKRYAGKTMADAGLTAHDAFSDIKGTYSIFVAQQKQESYGPVNMYGEDGVIKDMEFLGEIKPCFSIGKYRGVSVEYIARIDQGYISWCVGPKSNFLQSTKEYISRFIKI